MQLRRAGVRGQQRRQPRGIAARHAALGADAIDARVAAGGGETGRVAVRVVVMDQPEISPVPGGSSSFSSGAK